VSLLVVYDLESLAALRQRAVQRSARNVLLALPELSHVENERWSVYLTRKARSCGCAAGAAAFVIFLAAIVGALAVGFIPTSALSVWRALGLFALAIGLIGVGKLWVKSSTADA
jgi:hypothetical protein